MAARSVAEGKEAADKDEGMAGAAVNIGSAVNVASAEGAAEDAAEGAEGTRR